LVLNEFFRKLINFYLVKVYKRNISRFGYSPLGVFWNSKESQYSRFRFLISLIEEYSNKKKVGIADVGCGYGELFVFLKTRKIIYDYKGYDINSEIISFCNNRFSKKLFFVSEFPKEICDFCIISGTYNYAVIDNISLWENYILHNLVKCFEMCDQGIAINFQISKSKKIKNKIFYTDIHSMKNLLEKKFKKIKYFFDKNTPNDIYFLILR